MITKFLVFSDTIYLASNRVGLENRDELVVVDMKLPLKTFWEADKILKEIDFLKSSFEEKIKIQALYISFFKLIAPFAVHEKDRILLYKKIGIKGQFNV